MTISKTLLPALALALALGVAACGGSDDEGTASGSGGGGGDLSGKIAIDGSSTVAPFAQAAAELFNEENPDVQITVGASGTGGGFEKFCAGETDISDASRPIKDDEEVPVCEENSVSYGEVQIANDGIAVVTNKALAVDCLTTDELQADLEQGLEGQEPRRRQAGSPRHGAVALRAGHRLRHVRLLHRRDQRRGGRRRARTTSPPRTTTSSSRASRVTTAASATSASPTTRARRTSSTWSAWTPATAA